MRSGLVLLGAVGKVKEKSNLGGAKIARTKRWVDFSLLPSLWSQSGMLKSVRRGDGFFCLPPSSAAVQTMFLLKSACATGAFLFNFFLFRVQNVIKMESFPYLSFAGRVPLVEVPPDPVGVVPVGLDQVVHAARKVHEREPGKKSNSKENRTTA